MKLSQLWHLVEKTFINKRYINLRKSTYDDSIAYIKTDVGITRPVEISKEVKQEDVLSAILFCIVAAAVVTDMEENCASGFSIGGHLLSNLSYADDMAIINDSKEKLQESLNCLAISAARFGLHVNVSKTKCTTTDKTNHTLNVSKYNEQITQVTEFVYLGHKLTSNNNG